jgi:signal transduction histidine kinase
LRGSSAESRSRERLRERLERLEGLPVRPATVRAWLARLGRSPERGIAPADAAWRRLADADPGWALAAPRAEDGWSIAAAQPWWRPGPPSHEEALGRIWRHAVAVSRFARRLALNAGRAEQDAERMAGLGLLSPLGAWALAAADLGALAEWLDLADPARRRAWERQWLGEELAWVGHDLARRWSDDPALEDVAWLQGEGHGAFNPCAGDPAALSLVQAAVSGAERTPWALWPVPWNRPSSGDVTLRVVMAEVQARCGEPFIAPDANDSEEEASRIAARTVLALRDSERERAADRALIGELAASAPGDRGDDAGLGRDRELVRAAWGMLRAERARLRRQIAAIQAAARGVLPGGELRVVPPEALLDALAEFAAGAGHELNNPLSVVLGRAQLLLAKTDDPDRARALRAIMAQAQRAHRIVRDLMAFARPGASEPRPCRPDELLAEAARDLAPEAEARGASLRVDVPEAGSSARLWAAPDALRFVADALLRNAVEATPAGGTVLVVGRSTPAGVDWTIDDEGPGITPEQVPKLFDPFYCGRSAGRGLGLGLPRAAQLLRRLGGRLEWRSRPGEGSWVRVQAPGAPVQQAQVPAPLPSPAPIARGRSS